jgi:hypothetical protein
MGRSPFRRCFQPHCMNSVFLYARGELEEWWASEVDRQGRTGRETKNGSSCPNTLRGVVKEHWLSHTLTPGHPTVVQSVARHR